MDRCFTDRVELTQFFSIMLIPPASPCSGLSPILGISNRLAIGSLHPFSLDHHHLGSQRPSSFSVACWSSGVISFIVFLAAWYRRNPQIAKKPESRMKPQPITSNTGCFRKCCRPVPAMKNATDVRKNASSVLSLAMMVRPMVRKLGLSRLVRSDVPVLF